MATIPPRPPDSPEVGPGVDARWQASDLPYVDLISWLETQLGELSEFERGLVAGYGWASYETGTERLIQAIRRWRQFGDPERIPKPGLRLRLVPHDDP